MPENTIPFDYEKDYDPFACPTESWGDDDEVRRVYVASPFHNRQWARELAARIREETQSVVVSSWHDYDEKEVVDYLSTDAAAVAYNALICEMDSADLLVVLLCAGPSEMPVTSVSGGVHVELGYALAQKKEVVVVGKPTNVFHSLTVVFSYKEFTDHIERNGLVSFP